MAEGMYKGRIHLRRLRPIPEPQITVKEEEEEFQENNDTLLLDQSNNHTLPDIAEESMDEELNEEEVVPPMADSETIQKNMENIKNYSQKKLDAQRLFYQENGEVPEEEKMPVRERLGTRRLRRLTPLRHNANNNQFVKKKTILRRPGTNTGNANSVNIGNGNRFQVRRGGNRLKRLNNSIRPNSSGQRNIAQARLERIRAQHKQTLAELSQQHSNYVPVRLRKLQNLNNQNRVLPSPQDIVVQVKNEGVQPSLCGQTYSGPIERFKLRLNPEIQNMIRQYGRGRDVVPLPSDTRIIAMTTTIDLSSRFSRLS